MRRIVIYSLSALIVASVCVACGDAGSPLGGPYGGKGSFTPPNGGGSEVLGSPAGTGGSGASSGASSGGSAGTGGTGGSTGAGGSGGTSGTYGSGGSSGSGGTGGTGGTSGSGGSSGSGGTAGSAPDAGASMTWTAVWTTYLSPTAPSSTSCTGSCHRHTFDGAGTPKGTYTWLQGRGYIDGTTNPPLLNSARSCFSWLGGNMPPGGPGSDSGANTDFEAWAAAGGLDN